MSKHSKRSQRVDSALVEVKSKFDAEFRRFAVDRERSTSFEDFQRLVECVHSLKSVTFVICYTDPEGDLLPINNDDNFARALTTAKPLLRLLVQHKGESYEEVLGYGTIQRKQKGGGISKIGQADVAKARAHMAIGMPADFRRVSAIIDVDTVPESHRRVKLMKNGSEKPLGFYIRDGTSVRVVPHGLEKVSGIFISRLVPGGLAESTGLLAVNDEVLEVNGIEVSGKTLDQVTDMMVANSSNLIITVKPVNQRNNISPRYSTRTIKSMSSQRSAHSAKSTQSGQSMDSDEVREFLEEEEDEVKEHISSPTPESTPVSITSLENASPPPALHLSDSREPTPPPADKTSSKPDNISANNNHSETTTGLVTL